MDPLNKPYADCPKCGKRLIMGDPFPCNDVNDTYEKHRDNCGVLGLHWETPTLSNAVFNAGTEYLKFDADPLLYDTPKTPYGTMALKAEESQVGGDHYTDLAIQPMRYSMVNKLDACQHTIIKYVTRFRDKGGIEDLEKAKHCIDLLIEFEREFGRA